MKVLVFGQTGQLGHALGLFPGVTCLPRETADLSNPDACAALIAETDADAIINAAAYTAVDAAEQEQVLADQINGHSPAAMARAAAARGLPFVHVSTDYVFDGSGTTPFAADAPIHPINAYGRSKALGEQGIAAAGGAYVILRTSWVFSAWGKNFVKTMLALADTRDQLSVVCDQIGGPTAAMDIARTCLTLADSLRQHPDKAGIYHYSGQPETSWAGFAREIFAQAGKNITVHDIPSRDFPTPAQRPANSRLDCSGLKAAFGIDRPDWRRSLAEVLQELNQP